MESKTYGIRLKTSAVKELKRLPRKAQHKITEAINDLQTDPRPPGSRKLSGTPLDLWRIRKGDYRIVYLIDDSILIVEIQRIGHRKDVYRL